MQSYSARHANVFNVNLNIKPSSKVMFNLTYEEFLIRKLGRYEHVINIRPEQVNLENGNDLKIIILAFWLSNISQIAEIPDYKITVNILESQNITLLQVPKIRNDTELEYGVDGKFFLDCDWNPTGGVSKRTNFFFFQSKVTWMQWLGNPAGTLQL